MTTRQQMMCTFWKNERNMIHFMNTGLIHFTRHIYVWFDVSNDHFITRSKILWVHDSMSIFWFFSIKSFIEGDRSTFSPNTVLLSWSHILHITRLEILDNLEIAVKMLKKKQKKTWYLHIFQIISNFWGSYSHINKTLFKYRKMIIKWKSSSWQWSTKTKTDIKWTKNRSST